VNIQTRLANQSQVSTESLAVNADLAGEMTIVGGDLKSIPDKLIAWPAIETICFLSHDAMQTTELS